MYQGRTHYYYIACVRVARVDWWQSQTYNVTTQKAARATINTRICDNWPHPHRLSISTRARGQQCQALDTTGHVLHRSAKVKAALTLVTEKHVTLLTLQLRLTRGRRRTLGRVRFTQGLGYCFSWLCVLQGLTYPEGRYEWALVWHVHRDSAVRKKRMSTQASAHLLLIAGLKLSCPL